MNNMIIQRIMGQIHNVVLVGDPDDDEQDTVVLPYLDSKEILFKLTKHNR